jgi:hypothetical protein
MSAGSNSYPAIVVQGQFNCTKNVTLISWFYYPLWKPMWASLVEDTAETSSFVDCDVGRLTPEYMHRTFSETFKCSKVSDVGLPQASQAWQQSLLPIQNGE